MSIARLSAVSPGSFDVLSVDLFDTLLLRDGSSQRERFHKISSLAAARLHEAGYDVAPAVLAALKADLHTMSYRAVNIERPAGDAQLWRIDRLLQQSLGLAEDALPILRASEMAIEREHLAVNRPLLEVLAKFSAAGKAIVATSDTYYSVTDLKSLLADVVGSLPFDRLYSSSDIGLTKYAGGLFQEVASREQVETSRILHCGDNLHSDVRMARAAGCQTIHLQRSLLVGGLRKVRAGLFLLNGKPRPQGRDAA